MGEIRPKKCEGRELTKDQLAAPIRLRSLLRRERLRLRRLRRLLRHVLLLTRLRQPRRRAAPLPEPEHADSRGLLRRRRRLQAPLLPSLHRPLELHHALQHPRPLQPQGRDQRRPGACRAARAGRIAAHALRARRRHALLLRRQHELPGKSHSPLLTKPVSRLLTKHHEL